MSKIYVTDMYINDGYLLVVGTRQDIEDSISGALANGAVKVYFTAITVGGKQKTITLFNPSRGTIMVGEQTEREDNPDLLPKGARESDLQIAI